MFVSLYAAGYMTFSRMGARARSLSLPLSLSKEEKSLASTCWCASGSSHPT